GTHHSPLGRAHDYHHGESLDHRCFLKLAHPEKAPPRTHLQVRAGPSQACPPGRSFPPGEPRYGPPRPELPRDHGLQRLLSRETAFGARATRALIFFATRRPGVPVARPAGKRWFAEPDNVPARHAAARRRIAHGRGGREADQSPGKP